MECSISMRGQSSSINDFYLNIFVYGNDLVVVECFRDGYETGGGKIRRVWHRLRRPWEVLRAEGLRSELRQYRQGLRRLFRKHLR